ncbi:MAG: hypothetical protein ACLPUO_07785 [Streptosporangiaceae bacterium]
MLIGQGAQNRSIWRNGPRLAVDARPPCPTIWRESRPFTATILRSGYVLFM